MNYEAKLETKKEAAWRRVYERELDGPNRQGAYKLADAAIRDFDEIERVKQREREEARRARG